MNTIPCVFCDDFIGCPKVLEAWKQASAAGSDAKTIAKTREKALGERSRTCKIGKTKIGGAL
jgi:hypothetical protein